MTRHLTLFVTLCSIVLLITPIYESDATTIPKYDGSHAYISIWFDHAFDSQYVPIKELTDMGIPCGILTVMSKDGTLGYMTWDQIIEQKNAGCEIISHSINHVNILPLTPINITLSEVVGSKYALIFAHGITPKIYASPADYITPYSASIISSQYKGTILGGCVENTVTKMTNNALVKGFTIRGIQHCGSDVMNGTVAPIGNFTAAKDYIDRCVLHKTYCAINFHQIDEIKSAYHTSHDQYEMIRGYIVQQIQAGNLTAVTPSQGLGI